MRASAAVTTRTLPEQLEQQPGYERQNPEDDEKEHHDGHEEIKRVFVGHGCDHSRMSGRTRRRSRERNRAAPCPRAGGRVRRRLTRRSVRLGDVVRGSRRGQAFATTSAATRGVGRRGSGSSRRSAAWSGCPCGPSTPAGCASAPLVRRAPCRSCGAGCATRTTATSAVRTKARPVRRARRLPLSPSSPR